MKKLFSLIVVLGLLFSGNANTNHYVGHDPNKKSSLDRAFESLQKGQNKKKRRELERRIRRLELERNLGKRKVEKNLSVQERGLKLAKSGDPILQWGVGYSFILGDEGFEKDPRQGKFWLEESIKQYFSPAMVTLGWYYYTGEGIEKDFKKALQLSESASQLGHPIGSYNLGFFFYHGQLGLDNSFSEAKKYFIISAEQYLKSYNSSTKKYILEDTLERTPEYEAVSFEEELNLFENKQPKMMKLKEAFINAVRNPSQENIEKIRLVK